MTSRSMRTTSTPGIYRSGDRYVVVLRDSTGHQFKRSTRTLAEARTLKATLSADLARGEVRDSRGRTQRLRPAQRAAAREGTH